MRRPAWFVRPSECGGRPVHANAHVPKYGWNVQHLYTETEWIVIQAMRGLGKRLPSNAWLVKDGSLTLLQAVTAKFTGNDRPLARATLRDAIRRLLEKHIICRWDVTSEKKAGARSRGDGRWLTCWRILSYDETLAAIAADPRLAHPGRRAFYVVGKGKRLVTDAEATAWKLNVKVAEATGPAAWAGGTREEFAEYKGAEPAKPEKMKPPDVVASIVTQDVLKAARRNTLLPPEGRRVEKHAAICAKVAGERGEMLTSGDLCAILDQTAQYFGKAGPRTFEGHITAAPGQTNIYLDLRVEQRKAMAAALQRTGTEAAAARRAADEQYAKVMKELKDLDD